MDLDMKILLLAGVILWWADLGLIAYYVGRYMAGGGRRPSPFVLVTMIFCLLGGGYNLVRLAFGPSMTVFVLMSSASTLASMILFVAIVAKLVQKDAPPFNEN